MNNLFDNTVLVKSNNLTKVYREYNQGIEGIANANFIINRGETVGLIGANGAGKSTLIKLIVGILEPDSGSVKINDIASGDFKRKSPHRYLGYSPETFFFVSKLTGWEYIEFLSSIYMKDMNEDKDISFIEIAKEINLYDNLNKLLTKYSQGMLRKLSICTAIYFGTELIILDEPTNGLDPDSYIALRNILTRIKSKNRTILLSTHQMTFVDEVCDRLLVCKQGELFQPQKSNLTAEEVYKKIKN